MRPATDLLNNPAGLVDQRIGELYLKLDSILAIAGQIQQLSYYMEEIVNVAAIIDEISAVGPIFDTVSQGAASTEIGEKYKVRSNNDNIAFYVYEATSSTTGNLVAEIPSIDYLETKAPVESPSFTGTVSGITKNMVGLSNVDNTTDILKPISTAQQAKFSELEADIDELDDRTGIVEGLVAEGVTKKILVAVASTGALTLSGEETIDGVLTSASRVLVKNQASSSANGVYVSAAGAWARATDIDIAAEVVGTLVYVNAGTVNGGKTFATNSVVVTLNTDPIVWLEIRNETALAAKVAKLEAFPTHGVWPDTLFEYFTITGTAQAGKVRYGRDTSDLSLVDNSVYQGKALRVNGNNTKFAGPLLWLSEMGAVVGDTVNIKAQIIGGGATCNFAARPLNAAGAFIGVQTAQSVVSSGSVQTVEITVTIPTDAVSIIVYPLRSAGTGTFDVLAIWGGVNGYILNAPLNLGLDYLLVQNTDLVTRVGNLESGLTPALTVNAVYGAHLLRQLAAKRARIPDGGQTLKIGLFGDSWTEISERWYDLIKDRFDTELGVGAPGWVSANLENNVPTGVSRIRTGTWVDENVTGTLGPDTSHAFTSDAAASLTIGGTGVTSFKIHWVSTPSGGSFDVGLSGGGVVTVNTAGTQAHGVTTVAGNSVASLVIDINTAGSGIYLLGVECLSSADPVTLHKLGSGGSTAARYVSIPAGVFTSAVTALDLDVAVIMLGTNDMSGNAVPTTFRSNIETIISRIRSGLPRCDILLVAPSDNGLTGRTYTMENYAGQLYEAAVDGNHAMIDFRELMGTYAEGNARGLYNDTAHVNAAGGRVQVNHLWKAMLSPE